MLEIFLAADAKSDPARVRNPAVFHGKAFPQERIANRTRKRYINSAALVHVPDLGTAETEFSAAKAVRVSRYLRPRGYLVFQILQILHSLSTSLTIASMPKDACPIQLPHDETTPCGSRSNLLGFLLMAIRSFEARTLIDEFLPNCDFSAGYKIRVNAPTSVVYECLLRSDFSQVWLVRLLMSIRSGKWLPRNRVPCDLRQRLKGTGFVVLAEIPDEELVIGVAGQFWRPGGGRCLELTADSFTNFSRPGYAKVAWNFKLRANSPEITVLSTETRIKCFGLGALWKFRLYWSLVCPFSGFMRKAILKEVKTEAESIG